jgi:hypothetical protein
LNQVFLTTWACASPITFFERSAEGSTGAAHTIGNLIIAVDKVLGK